MTSKMKRVVSISSALVIATVMLIGGGLWISSLNSNSIYQGPIVALALEGYPGDRLAFSVCRNASHGEVLLGAINKVINDLGDEKIAELVRHHTDVDLGRTSTLSFYVPTPGNSGDAIYFYTAYANSPFSYLGANNSSAGVNWDIMRFVAVELGMRLEARFSVFGGIIQAVTQQTSEWRMIGDAVFITEAREQILTFSDVYWTSMLAVISKKSNSWNTLAQLDGRRIGGMGGGIGAIYIQRQLDNGTLSSATQLLEYTAIQTAFMDLLAGRIDAVVFPDYATEKLIASRR